MSERARGSAGDKMRYSRRVESVKHRMFCYIRSLCALPLESAELVL